MSERAENVELPKVVRANRSRVDSWLDTAARRGNAQCAAIFVAHAESVKIVSCYPEVRKLDAEMIAVARRAFKRKRVIHKVEDSDNTLSSSSTAYIGLYARAFGTPSVIVLKLVGHRSEDDAALLARIEKLVLRRAADKKRLSETKQKRETDVDKMLLSTSPEKGNSASATRPILKEKNQEKPQSTDEALDLIRAQGAAIGALATVLDHQSIEPSLHALANCLARAWSCLRVTIGVVRAQRMEVKAVSGSVQFDSRSALIVDICHALEETRSAAETIVLSPDTKSSLPRPAHTTLANQLKKPALLSVPLLEGDRIIGAVLLERDKPFSPEEQRQIERTAILIAPVIALKVVDAMGLMAWLSRSARRQLGALFGSSKLGWKLGAIALLVLMALSTIFTQTFRIDAEASIEASVNRAVVANIPSFLSQVETKAGDIVQQGDVLAVLDVEDLELDRINWAGEFDKLSKEYRAVLAQRDRSDLRVIEARRAQAQSRLDLLDAQIERAILRAPIEGVVVSGDLTQALGSPVERGQLLFEVASLDDYRLVLMVDESDIGWVEIGSQGNLRLRSLPDRTFSFTVSAITPVSEPGEGANRFRVEATAIDLPTTLRPGMEGAAKIDIEPRAIGWIWTRSFVNWLRFQAWKYGF